MGGESACMQALTAAMAEDPGARLGTLGVQALRRNQFRKRASSVRAPWALVLAVLVALTVRAQEEASPCQALVEAGASAHEVRQCYIVQTQRQPFQFLRKVLLAMSGR